MQQPPANRLINRLLLLLVAVTVSSVCYADAVQYTITGAFDATAPNSLFTAPSTPFQLQFETDGIPLPGVHLNASDFTISSTIRYQLDGGREALYPASPIGYYSQANGGGLYLQLSDGATQFHVSLGGPALFTGDPTNPTLLEGTFPYTGPSRYTYYTLNGMFHYFVSPVTVTATIDDVQTVPESSELLMTAGALGFALYAASRTRN